MPSSVYDDPELQGGADDRFKLEDIGDRVRGRVVNVEKFSGQTKGLRYVLADVTARQLGHQVQVASGSLIATASKLLAELMERKPDVGDILDIQLTNKTPAQVGFLKHFAVTIEKASGPTPSNVTAHPANPQPQLADDLFG